MTDSEVTTERREFERYPLMLDAKVSVGHVVVDCVIFYISHGGARIRLTGTEIRSEIDQIGTVVLHIPDFGGFEGKVIWTDDEYVGIQFTELQKTMVKLVIAAAS